MRIFVGQVGMKERGHVGNGCLRSIFDRSLLESVVFWGALKKILQANQRGRAR